MPVPQVAVDADLVLIAVRDDVLPGLVSSLCVEGSLHAGQFVVHPSGRFGIDVLHPAADAGAIPLALHPVMTFTGTSVDLARLEDCPFGVTTLDQVRPIAEALVVEMGGEPVWVPEESRALYHASVSFGANYLMAVVRESIDLLARAGIEHPEHLMAPLLSASLDNALRHGYGALTGPVARGDAATVGEHLRQLHRTSPEAASAYQALARLTADRAMAAGILAPADAERLLDVLAGTA